MPLLLFLDADCTRGQLRPSVLQKTKRYKMVALPSVSIGNIEKQGQFLILD